MAGTGGPATRTIGAKGGAAPFWVEPGALDVAAALLLPDRRTLEYRLRGGQAYRLALEALGFAEIGLPATPDPAGRGILLAFASCGFVEVASSRLLAASEPAYRAASQAAAAEAHPFGARVRAHRLAQGRSAREVASLAGMAPSHFSRLEASRHQARLDTLERVAAALGVKVEDLLAGPR